MNYFDLSTSLIALKGFFQYSELRLDLTAVIIYSVFLFMNRRYIIEENCLQNQENVQKITLNASNLYFYHYKHQEIFYEQYHL